MSQPRIVAQHDGDPGEGPPRDLDFKYCPVCGRTNIFMSMGRTCHFTNGKPCDGKPVAIKYQLVEDDRG